MHEIPDNNITEEWDSVTWLILKAIQLGIQFNAVYTNHRRLLTNNDYCRETSHRS